jgi:riboflavin synthase
VFTGLIQEVAKVKKAEKRGQDLWLSLEAPKTSARLKIGDSVAVNGCCLTVVELKAPVFSFQAVPETLSRTALGALLEGSLVNLELPLTLSETLGGHFVQGHVDGKAEILGFKPEGEGFRMKVRVPESLTPYVVEKGSIALDGISLTVASIRGSEVEVALIPHTMENTDLKSKKVGDVLHVEVDMLAKHLAKLALGYFQERKAP